MCWYCPGPLHRHFSAQSVLPSPPCPVPTIHRACSVAVTTAPRTITFPPNRSCRHRPAPAPSLVRAIGVAVTAMPPHHRFYATSVLPSPPYPGTMTLSPHRCCRHHRSPKPSLSRPNGVAFTDPVPWHDQTSTTLVLPSQLLPCPITPPSHQCCRHCRTPHHQFSAQSGLPSPPWSAPSHFRFIRVAVPAVPPYHHLSAQSDLPARPCTIASVPNQGCCHHHAPNHQTSAPSVLTSPPCSRIITPPPH